MSVLGYSDAQVRALNAAFDKNGAIYGRLGSPMGGAYLRMCEKLVADKLISPDHPHAITIKGLKVLRDIRAARYARHGCVAYLSDLKTIEDALATVPTLAARS